MEPFEVVVEPGEIADLRDRLAAYREAGVTHLTITPVPTGDQTAESIVENVKTWSN